MQITGLKVMSFTTRTGSQYEVLVNTEDTVLGMRQLRGTDIGWPRDTWLLVWQSDGVPTEGESFVVLIRRNGEVYPVKTTRVISISTNTGAERVRPALALTPPLLG